MPPYDDHQYNFHKAISLVLDFYCYYVDSEKGIPFRGDT